MCDYTLCGLDTSGDDEIHYKEPEQLPEGVKHRVTCEKCQQVIELVKLHLKKS